MNEDDLRHLVASNSDVQEAIKQRALDFVDAVFDEAESAVEEGGPAGEAVMRIVLSQMLKQTDLEDSTSAEEVHERTRAIFAAETDRLREMAGGTLGTEEVDPDEDFGAE